MQGMWPIAIVGVVMAGGPNKGIIAVKEFVELRNPVETFDDKLDVAQGVLFSIFVTAANPHGRTVVS